jgi:hypothetical protein
VRVSEVNQPLDEGDGPWGQLVAHTVRFRIRPGDTPVWIDASAAYALFDRWRTDAADTRMPVDGLISARWELCLAMEELEVNLRALRRIAGILMARPRRLPPVHLRPWVAVLRGARPQDDVDELPEVVMPSRIGRNLPETWWSGSSRISAQLARSWELLAASHGFTIREMVWQGIAGTTSISLH